MHAGQPVSPWVDDDRVGGCAGRPVRREGTGVLLIRRSLTRQRVQLAQDVLAAVCLTSSVVMVRHPLWGTGSAVGR